MLVKRLVKRVDKNLAEFFLEHPKTVGETYGGHFWQATRIGASLIVAGGACFVHALLPGAFVNTASNKIRALAAEIEERQEVVEHQELPVEHGAIELSLGSKFGVSAKTIFGSKIRSG